MGLDVGAVAEAVALGVPPVAHGALISEFWPELQQLFIATNLLPLLVRQLELFVELFVHNPLRVLVAFATTLLGALAANVSVCVPVGLALVITSNSEDRR